MPVRFRLSHALFADEPSTEGICGRFAGSRNILREDWKPVLSLQSVMVGLQYLFLEP